MLEAIDLSIQKENIDSSFQEITMNKDIDDLADKSPDSGQDNESLFSPPKKKLKQDQLKFIKVTKTIENQHAKPDLTNGNMNGIDMTTDTNKMEVDTIAIDCGTTVQYESDNRNCMNQTLNDSTEGTKAVTSPTSQDTSPKVVLSKEERKRQKEQKEQEKAIRMKELDEKKQKREEERKKREAEKERKEQERKEKEKLKEEERRKKEEEKRKKEEEKKIKEIEKKKKEELKELEKEKREAEKKVKEAEKRIEEEKRKQEEEALRRKKEKAANQFKSFFTKKTSKPKVEGPIEEMFIRFKPFQMTASMTLAPVCRIHSFQKLNFDKFMEKDNLEQQLYIQELEIRKQRDEFKKYISRCSLRKIAMEEKKIKSLRNKTIDEKDIIVLSDDEEDDGNDNYDGDNDSQENSFNESTSKNIYKAKYFQFSENTRPAYYGTWRKKTIRINGRKIHGLDNEIFNYDIDSDEEWIDEPGEDLSDDNPDEEEEKDDKETEDDQDGFFVPHGYLSDDEGVHDSNGEEEDEDANAECEKENYTTKIGAQAREQDKLKVKASSFEAEMRKQIKPKKPVCIGIIYNHHPSLTHFGKIHFVDNPEEKEDISVSSLTNTPKFTPSCTSKNNIHPSNIPESIPEEAMPHFVRFLHGNSDGLSKLIPAFQELWSKHVQENNIDCRTSISKRQIIKKVQEISSKTNDINFGKICYIVNDNVLMQYDLIGDNMSLVSKVSPADTLTIGETHSEEIITWCH